LKKICKEVVVDYLGVLSWNYPGRTKENFDNIQDNWLLSQNMNLEIPEYEGKVLTSRTRPLFEAV
jgi:hypothetical protein